jgi:signal transduction histidine kinase
LIGIFAAISLLELLAFFQRSLLKVEVQNNVQRVIHGWDGWVWYVWLLAAPATLLLIRRCRWRREHPIRCLAPILIGSLAIYLVVSNLRYLLRILPNLWLPDDQDLPLTWANYFQTETVLLPIDFITYCGFFATSFALEQYFKSRRRTEEVLRLQLAGARLQSELARAQYSALLRQLQPHFLFNAFNAVSSLVRQRKNESAVRMIAELGELLRLTMERVDEQEVPLRQDLVYVQHYLNIEQVRFGDKLRFEIVADEGIRHCLVPNLLLQPLVENAVKHGISRRTTAGCIRLSAARFGQRLKLSLSDDGPGFGGASGARPDGIGLSNTRSRLQSLYGSDFTLEMTSAPEGGTTVLIDLPWRQKRKTDMQEARP